MIESGELVLDSGAVSKTLSEPGKAGPGIKFQTPNNSGLAIGLGKLSGTAVVFCEFCPSSGVGALRVELAAAFGVVSSVELFDVEVAVPGET